MAWGQVLPTYLINAHEQVSLGVRDEHQLPRGGGTGWVPPGGGHGWTLLTPAINHLWKPLGQTPGQVSMAKVSMTHYPISLAVYLSMEGACPGPRRGQPWASKKGNRELLGCR